MSSNRASLLAGLRTGGPRSVSSSYQNHGFSNGAMPQTAGADASGFAAQQRKELNRRSSLMSADVGALDNFQGSFDAQVPATAPANDYVFAQLQQQQQQQQAQFLLLQAQLQAQALQAALSGNGRQQQQMYAMTPEQQAMQLQIEMLKIQQNALFAQAQAQVQQSRNVAPRTAGPGVTSFGNVAPRHRASSLAKGTEGPMTAALDGRFVSATPRSSSGLNPNAAAFQMGSGVEPTTAPPAANASANWRSANGVTAGAPLTGGATAGSKQHESTTSWRRPSVARQSSEVSEASTRSTTPPTVYVSTPEETSNEHLARSRSNSPPHAFAAGVARAHSSRPQSLQFKLPTALQTRIQEEVDAGVGQEFEIASPVQEHHDVGLAPLSPSREEAARRLYEGLGIGRPQPGSSAAGSQGPEVARHVSQPVRQPRGPPGGPDELGARNFASRIRSQGLGVLKEHHARRQSQNMGVAVEAY